MTFLLFALLAPVLEFEVGKLQPGSLTGETGVLHHVRVQDVFQVLVAPC